MKIGTRLLRWCMLLSKRLYKQWTFLLLLAMIPLLVIGYGVVSQEESGVLTIALASQSSQTEPMTRQVMDDLLENKLILFVECDSPESARELVSQGNADAAWIFAADLEEKIYDFVAQRTRKNAFITLVEPERTVPLLMAREILSGTLFSHCSEALYLTYIRANAPELDAVSDEKLMQYYHSMHFDDGLFAFTDLQGRPVAQSDTEQTYLLAPVRGMLAVLLVLAGLATGMYFIRDRENGTFSWLAERHRPLAELTLQLICLLHVSLVVMLALMFSGQTVAIGREVLTALLYCLCVAAFSMTVTRLAGGMRGLGMVTPLLVVVMLVICPVFFDVGKLRPMQYLFPPTYFINGSYNPQFLGSMAVYTLALLALCRLLDKIKRI